MVFDVIPFYEVKSIWIGKSKGGICPGFVNSSQESAAMFLQSVAKINERMPETEAGADNLHYIKDMVDRAFELRSLMRRPTRSGTRSAKSSS